MLCQFNHGTKVTEISDISQFQGIFLSTTYQQYGITQCFL
ncbi:hypothetical protein BACINT_02070 [Bacteroides intestinalis DSM 17393]|uniref:Uncharacterized protein n=1 Tax=Bacteroides intestinalis DSM 17393 TaxID=471870 RepID=B3CC33_9BACE|nr:hypothetical protein BACINT_02070 [Bacteroides intestinalis DSM 17393]